MRSADTTSEFEARLRRPASSTDEGDHWAFVLIPKHASDKLPRRGRTTVEGTLNGKAFVATLEPDGGLSHWLRVDEALLDAAGAKVGDEVAIRIAAVEQEPEPTLPSGKRRVCCFDPSGYYSKALSVPKEAD